MQIAYNNGKQKFTFARTKRTDYRRKESIKYDRKSRRLVHKCTDKQFGYYLEIRNRKWHRFIEEVKNRQDASSGKK